MSLYFEALGMLKGLQQALRDQQSKHDQQVVKVDTMIEILNNMATQLEGERARSEQVARVPPAQPALAAHDPSVVLEQFKNALARDNEAIRRRHEWEIKLFDSVLGAGATALKTSMVINGGAIVALMAFAGSMVAKAGALSPGAVFNIGLAGVGFFCGVLLAGLGTAGTYFAQYCYMKHLEQEGELANNPEGAKERDSLPRFGLRGDIMRLLTWGVGTLSYAALVAGFWYAKPGVEMVLTLQ